MWKFINVDVDKSSNSVSQHGKYSILIIIIFFLGSKIICHMWEVGSQVFEKKKEHLLSLVGMGERSDK